MFFLSETFFFSTSTSLKSIKATGKKNQNFSFFYKKKMQILNCSLPITVVINLN